MNVYCNFGIKLILFAGGVYDITSYVKYHPGGEGELMKGAGIDSTKIFNEVHKWVNFAGMLKECLVGYLVTDPVKRPTQPTKRATLSVTPAAGKSSSSLSVPDTAVFKVPQPASQSAPKSASIVVPNNDVMFSFDMYQTNQCVTLITYCKTPKTQFKEVSYVGHVIKRQLNFLIYHKNKCFVLEIDLFSDIESFQVRQSAVKTEIVLQKSSPENWPSEGTHSKNSEKVIDISDSPRLINSSIILSKREVLTHDTELYTFNYSPGHVGKPAIGAHIFVNSPLISKPYTIVKPLNTPDTNDTLHLLVKTYPQGAVSGHIHSLKLNDELSIQCFDHQFDMNRVLEHSKVVMIAAGTGITPMIRIIDKIVFDQLFSVVSCELMFYNKTEDDVPLGDDLSKLVELSNMRFRYENILSQPKHFFTSRRGHIDASHLERHADECLYLVCGPRPFMKLAQTLLHEKGAANVVMFQG